MTTGAGAGAASGRLGAAMGAERGACAGTTIGAGRKSAARPSPAATVRLAGPMPNAQRDDAGARFGAPCATIRRFLFTTSVSACSYPETSDSQAWYRERFSTRSRLPGIRRVRLSEICEPKPAARWIA